MIKPGLGHSPFYGILDADYVNREDWVNKCRALIEGGAGIIQLRAKRCSHSERMKLLESILFLFEQNSAPPLVINDDLKLALQYPDLGLHIGQDDTPVSEARSALGPERILGLSTHSLEQARKAVALADTLTYFAVGPVFATQTKPTYTPVGLELVALVAELNPVLPWYAIGGIHLDNVKAVRAHGAQRVVAVSDVLCHEDTCARVQSIIQLLN